VPAPQLEGVALRIGPRVLEACRTRYAQHPYVTGRFRGHPVDLVPAYRVPDAASHMSAVDRTPFHTAWVARHLDAAMRDQVRLAKRWLKGTALYGAQTATGGMSGYLVEVLVARLGSFGALVDWLGRGAQPRRVAGGPDEVEDEVSPLVVVDPVDPARNCAAAVTSPTLERAQAAAQAYRHAPQRRFFFPAPPRPEPAPLLHEALSRQAAAWAGLTLHPATTRLDIVFPQFQRALRTLAAELGRHHFPVARSHAAVSPDESEILLQFLCAGAPHPTTSIHMGPADDGRPHATRFRDKWSHHADAVGPVHTLAGRLAVELRLPHTTPAAWLRAKAPTMDLGRHVGESWNGSQAWDDPAAASPLWAPLVADIVLGREPWER
ncbi:MAG: hypothetical protein ACYDBQ_10445, partial [Thermoplasmatota archaeon]